MLDRAVGKPLKEITVSPKTDTYQDNCIFGERFRMRMYVRHRLRHVMVVSVHALGSSLEVLFKSLLAPHQNITAALKRHRVIKTAESALRLLVSQSFSVVESPR